MRLAVAALVWACASMAWSTSYGPPQKRTVRSPGGHAELRINPKTQVHSIYSSARSVLPRWTFKREVWHDDYVISDDGKLVVWIAWPHTSIDGLHHPVVEVRDSSGKVAQWTVEEVGPVRRYKASEVGPIGAGRRIWREGFEVKGDLLTIQLPFGRKAVWSLADGKRVK